jgi:hypothetical protein
LRLLVGSGDDHHAGFGRLRIASTSESGTFVESRALPSAKWVM